MKWAPSPGSRRLEAALAKQNRWWVRWVIFGVLGGLGIIVGVETCTEPAPEVFGGEPIGPASTQIPHPDPGF